MSLPRPVIAVLVGIALVWVVAILAWVQAPVGLTFDDSFYYFEIAQRFAAGQGSTFDGSHYTNGYHPLWMWLAAGGFAAGLSGETAVRMLLIAQVFLAVIGTGLGLAGLGWRPVRPAQVGFTAVVLGAWLAVPMILRTEVNGMESAAVVTVHGALLGLILARSEAAPHRWPLGVRLGVGALLGVSILARSDGALLTPMLLLASLPGLWKDGWRGWVAWLPIGVTPAVVLAAFLALNQLWFGTPLQVSGTLKRVTPGPVGVGIIVVCLVLAVGLWWLSRRGLGPAWPHLSQFLARTVWYGAFVFAITAYYTGLQTFARQWYFAPLVLWATIGLAALALDLAARALADKPQARPLAALGPLAAIVTLPLIAGAGYTTYQLARPATLAVRLADIEGAQWLDANLPADTPVASWDAGLIGYTAELPIINLDGVVNDVDWLHRMQHGTTGERLRSEQVRWIINHSFYQDGRCTSIEDSLARLDPTLAAQLELVKAWPFEQVGSINGVAGGRHTMATCVMKLVQPIPGEAP